MRSHTEDTVTGSTPGCSESIGLPRGTDCRAREQLYHFAVEHRQVFRSPAGHQVAIRDAFAVFPLAARIADVILNGVPAGEFAPSDDSGGNQFPRSMTNRGNGLS